MSLLLPILFSISCYLQDSPVDLSKNELPKIAHCVVCESNGEGQKEEKILAGVRYKGGVYYFCNVREADEFKKDPEAFLPPILPRPAPVFNGATIEGKSISSQDFAGKVILVDFWATWCVPCVKGMPEVDKIFTKYRDRGFVALGISIDEDTKKVAPFLKKKPVGYPILLDNLSTPSWAAFKVRAIPALFLIDRKGNIVAQWRGEVKPALVDAAIAEQLSK